VVQHIRAMIAKSMQFVLSSVPEISVTAAPDYPKAIIGVKDVLCSAYFSLEHSGLNIRHNW